MGSDHVLVCRVGERRCALPLDAVIETMRPLPIHPVTGVTEAVLGVCIIRGLATPVLDLAVLFARGDLKPVRVFIDSPLATRITSVFDHHIDEPDERPDLLRRFRKGGGPALLQQRYGGARCAIRGRRDGLRCYDRW